MKILKILLSVLLALTFCASLFACKKNNEEITDTDSQSNEASGIDSESDFTGEEETNDENGGDTDASVFEAPTTAGGKSYKSLYDAYDHTNMLYWDNVNEVDAKAYGDVLTDGGYSLLTANESAALWSATYQKNGSTAHIYYLKKLKEFRVLLSDGAKLPKPVSENEKKCEALITQVGTDKDTPSDGMGYIIQLVDGSFVLIDGGFDKNRDATNLYTRLNTLKNANGSEKIVIRAWFLTHGDKEHTGALIYFLDNYENQVIIESIVANDPADDVYKELGVKPGALAYSSMDGFFGGCGFIKAHTGYKFSFAGVEMNILYTHEDANEMKTTSFDSRTSMVIDAVIGDTRLLWLGDLETEGAARLEAMYGDTLDCDILQVSSGNNCGGEALYRLCSPDTVLWTGSETSMNAVKALPKNKYLLENTENIYYAYEGNKTLTFGENAGGDNMTDNGSVDEDGSYTDNY